MFVLGSITDQHEQVELRQLAYFDAVVRYGGFGRAAAHLHVAQPAVSVQIRKLETELGTPLLSRTTRRVGLTHAGELFLARTRRVLAELDAARADLQQLSGAVIGRVRIGAIQALGPFDLSGALAAFHAEHPRVELMLRSGALRALLDDLDQDRIDLALGPATAGLPAWVTAEPLFADELVLATHPDHPTAGAGPLGIGSLRDDPFVCLPADSGLRAILDRLAADAGFTPYVRSRPRTCRGCATWSPTGSAWRSSRGRWRRDPASWSTPSIPNRCGGPSPCCGTPAGPCRPRPQCAGSTCSPAPAAEVRHASSSATRVPCHHCSTSSGLHPRSPVATS